MSFQKDEARSTLLAPDPEVISKLQELFRIGVANPISIRAIKPREGQKSDIRNFTFTADLYPDQIERWTAAFRAGLDLNNTGFNVYTQLNPIKPDFVDGAVSGENILCRRLLFIDVDRVVTNDQPASDIEVKDAMRAADRIEGWMRQEGSIPCSRVMSGNGVHLYFRLDDWANDKRSRDACRKILHGLADMFNSASFKVDTSVSDAPRITKLPGTVAWKGLEGPHRPYRRAMFV